MWYWETHERILVAVTTAPGTDVIVRRAARMAGRIKADLQVLHVMTGNQSGGRPSDELVALRQLAGDVGASSNRSGGTTPPRS